MTATVEKLQEKYANVYSNIGLIKMLIFRMFEET